MKNESIQTVNDVMWSKAVFRANDSDVRACRKRVKSHKRYLSKRERERVKRMLARKVCLRWVFNRNMFLEYIFIFSISFETDWQHATDLQPFLYGQIFLMSTFGSCALNNKVNFNNDNTVEPCSVFRLKRRSSFEFFDKPLFYLHDVLFLRGKSVGKKCCFVLWFRLT